MRRMHGVFNSPPASAPSRYEADSDHFSISMPERRMATAVACPVEGCAGKAADRHSMRRHFMYMHPTHTIVIEEEGPLPKCQRCGMQCPDTRQHRDSKTCKDGQFRREQRERRARQQQARSGTKFYVDGSELERVREFKYLGRILSSQDDDWPAIRRQLRTAQGRWARVSRVLTREGANPRVSGMFYKAICQTVLLHGSETWVVKRTTLRALEGFHHRVARHLTRRHIRPSGLDDGQWVYPSTAETLAQAGLFPMTEYLTRRKATIMPFAYSLPIYQQAFESRPSAGSAHRKTWWEPTALSSAEADES